MYNDSFHVLIEEEYASCYFLGNIEIKFHQKISLVKWFFWALGKV